MAYMKITNRALFKKSLKVFFFFFRNLQTENIFESYFYRSLATQALVLSE